MPYQLLKARINCNYNRIIKPLKSLDNFITWTNCADFNVKQALAFSDSNLENATAQYKVSYQSTTVMIDLKLMQSTQLTSYCFDVFLVMNYNALNADVDKIVALYRERLEALRYQYNGNWIISDGDLTLTNLR